MYKIIEASSAKELQDKVNGNLQAGFTLSGGVAVTLKGTHYQGTGTEHIYYQAVLKEDQTEKESDDMGDLF